LFNGLQLCIFVEIAFCDVSSIKRCWDFRIEVWVLVALRHKKPLITIIALLIEALDDS
jgi:hypothetical protein